MNIYRHFAGVYDAFMTDMPYKHWAGYIDEVFQHYKVPKNGLVLDLACGTGTMAFLMSKKGYDIIGVDTSEDMLSEAYSKDYIKTPLFLKQDMRILDLYGTIDAAYASCDGMNYLLTEDDFLQTLKRIALFLNPGGVFIFDVKMEHRYKILGSGTYHDEVENASYIWKNSYNPATCINEYNVHFFVDQQDFIETHLQRAYSNETIKSLVAKAGLQLLNVMDNYSNIPAKSDSERLTYIVQYPQSQDAVQY